MKGLDSLVTQAASIAALRRDIHAHPELCFQEVRTADLVAAKLTEWGIPIHRGLGKTGVVGIVKNGTSDRAVGLRAERPGDLDGLIDEMIATDRPVIADVRVDQTENCYPMVPSGAAHNEMILGNDARSADTPRVTDQGLALV